MESELVHADKYNLIIFPFFIYKHLKNFMYKKYGLVDVDTDHHNILRVCQLKKTCEIVF